LLRSNRSVAANSTLTAAALFAAATRDGRPPVTTSLNIPAPPGALLARRAPARRPRCGLLGR
jgi:hypothetical protein